MQITENLLTNELNLLAMEKGFKIEYRQVFGKLSLSVYEYNKQTKYSRLSYDTKAEKFVIHPTGTMLDYDSFVEYEKETKEMFDLVHHLNKIIESAGEVEQLEFNQEKMKKMKESDSLVNKMTNDLVDRGMSECEALEIVFNGEVLGDSIMEDVYLKI